MLYDCKRNKNKLFLHILLASSNSLLVLFAPKLRTNTNQKTRLDAQKLTFVCDDDFGVTCFYQKIIVLPI